MDEDIKKVLDDHEKRIHGLELLFRSEKVPSSKRISIREFLLQIRPQSDVEKSLCVAYYLEKHEGLDSFTIKEIEAAFRAAKEPVPENINYKVIKNIEKGFVMESQQKKNHLKTWNLTSSGEGYVESRLGQG